MTSSIDPLKRQLLRGKLRVEQSIRLPWIISEANFMQGCTQCQKCIEVCETNIITRDAAGFPKIDFSKGECTFCQQCIQTYQEPLFISPLPINSHKNKSPLPWPITININEQCFAKNSIYCQSCRDECEEQAINFSYQINGESHSILQPKINHDDCSQCGACISICPQNAIVLNFQQGEQINSPTNIEVINVN